jgi:hypothetical protein
MIDNKELPQEYVSIRQVWLKQITRCSEAISMRYKNDMTITNGVVQNVGDRFVGESVLSLYFLLVDYGEATIKSEVKKRLHDLKSNEDFSKNAVLYYQRLFEYIIEVLNKYGMLFESNPKGYSNTVMKSV